MNFYDKNINVTALELNSDLINGLNKNGLEISVKKYGKNKLTEKKKQGFFQRLFGAMKEPMLLILLFGFILTFGINLGKFLKIGQGDFAECWGILGAIILSVSITLIMEGSSQKAFTVLNRIYDNVAVRIIRDGRTMLIAQQDVAVGDIVLLESGDKIIADGRLIESNSLSVDESALTGESHAQNKKANVVLSESTPLAERINCVFSGTFVTAGSGKMIVTAVGDRTEIGNIAGELSEKKQEITPLQLKLARLGKIITITGAVCACLVFALSIIRLAITKQITFSGIQELFVSCIILIVAAVPEGLPTIVAVSLALNMIKLAKQNALIKKITATETAGSVSVICSDKTGTITQNKMSVASVCLSDFCLSPEKLTIKAMHQNFICNSTADVVIKNKQKIYYGSGTECALIVAYMKSKEKTPYKDYRRSYPVIDREPFSSDKKYMITTIKTEDGYRKLLKGAPERVMEKCNLSGAQYNSIKKSMQLHQNKARRILCFAHFDYKESVGEERYIYDGFVAIEDPIRPEILKAVKDCKRAGIQIKILTGDNVATAFAIAKELGIANDESQIINAQEIEKLDQTALIKIMSKITVVARSTPSVKLRIVRALKSKGEVVAVTGDGINDAPAIKHADIGIAMGITGSEITKEAADIILLDDSFATVVKAVSFGRNVYRNLQRFILFQISVNLSALLFITVCAVLGVPTPFNTFQLLWINVIMDGPPALTLGL
ncbi:MAG: calcium-translocating P-type ATPase, PMCA-type, partial [Clostridia bacterium]|nr:calcium-translocating P-type ATPase, PMCA-type [Clostridia bacterium]